MSPKILSKVSSNNRKLQISKFIKELDNSQNIDAQKFWKFREFYSPGYFIFDRKGLEEKEKIEAFNDLKISPEFLEDDYIFLRFKSDHLDSIEALSNKSSIKDLKFIQKSTILNQGKDYILTRTDSKTLYLFFVLPDDALKRANGFLDYAEKDVELVRNKYWIVISKISLE